jgi:hypothetical protein
MALRNLILRFVFGALLAAMSLVVARMGLFKRFAEWDQKRFDCIYYAFYAASHFLVFVLVFLVLHQKPWADLPAFYVPQAHAVIHGLVPYRDFDSSYAPLNAYLDAVMLRLHDSPLSILIFQIVCDILSLPFWIRFSRRFLSEHTVRKAALLYLIQPLIIWQICIDGRNQGPISLLLGISFYAIGRREILSGVSLSMTWILVKILPVMFVPTLFVATRKRMQWLMGVLMPSVIVYGAFVLMRADVTEGLRKEGAMTTPQNLVYLFGALTGMALPHIVMSLLSAVVILAVLLVTIRAQLNAKSESAKLWKMMLGAELILLAVMMVNKKSDTSYLGMCFFLLCAFVAFETNCGRRAMIWFYAVLSFLSLPIVSFWYWPLQRQSAIQLHAMCLTGDRNALIMLAMQVLLVVSYLGLAFGILRAVREPQFESRVQGSPVAAVTGSAS